MSALQAVADPGDHVRVLNDSALRNVREPPVNVAEFLELVDEALVGSDVEEYGCPTPTLGEYERPATLSDLLEHRGRVRAEVRHGLDVRAEIESYLGHVDLLYF
jgi:hypothetical protein